MSAAPSRWALAVLPLATLPGSLAALLRNRGEWAQAWPLWRSMLIDLSLVLAGACLVAAVAFGVSAWRQARGGHHA